MLSAGRANTSTGEKSWLGVETDFALRLGLGRHQIAQGLKDGLNGLVVLIELAFQIGQLAGHGVLGGQVPSQADKGPHDLAIDRHRFGTAQHTCEAQPRTQLFDGPASRNLACSQRVLSFKDSR